MAFSFGFYNAVNHDRRYDAVQFGQIFDGIISDGVYATYKKALIVKASSTGIYSLDFVIFSICLSSKTTSTL